MSYDRLIDGYIAHAEAVAYDQSDTNFWAYEGLHALAEENPEAAWPAVLRVVDRTIDEKILNYVSADILEDLLCEHAHALIDRVETLARTDEHFRKALGNVWGWNRMPADVRARLDVLVGHAGRSQKHGHPTSGCS
jgi:hypothetical protein